jgi:ubiquinone/menaquinone biosynthesis C-methylase UbiE
MQTTPAAEKKRPFVAETRFGFWFLGTDVWHVSVLNRALDDLLRLHRSRTPRYPVVLDIGCGQGTSLLELPKRFGAQRLIAVDADAPSIEKAKATAKNCAVPVEWHCANSAALPVPDASVDMVFCHQTLHHIVDQEDALAEAFRVLKPGGVFLAAESTKAYIHSWIIRLLFRHPMHVQRTADEYVAMARAAGFTVAPDQISTPYLWWSRSDVGAFEWFGFPVPEKREETLVNFIAVKPA